jgi:hypothetical protein
MQTSPILPFGAGRRAKQHNDHAVFDAAEASISPKCCKYQRKNKSAFFGREWDPLDTG